VLFALGCVYSLAAPWLGQRAEASATSAADLKRAHGYDPLSTSVLAEWATFEGGRRGEQLYRQALSLEPTNAGLWYDLGAFYSAAGDWLHAVRAFDKAYAYDPFGLAGRKCGLAAEAYAKAGGKPVPASCRAGRRASSP